MDFFEIKQELISELWLPITIQGSKKLYPHRYSQEEVETLFSQGISDPYAKILRRKFQRLIGS